MIKQVIFYFLIVFNVVAGDFMPAATSTLLSQPDFSSTLNYTYFKNIGAAYIRLNAGTNTRTATLPFTNVAGSYRLFVLSHTPRTDGSMSINIGDSTNSLFITHNGNWTNTIVFNTSIGFSNVLLTLINANVSSIQDYHLAAFYLTSNTNESDVDNAIIANSPNHFVDYTPATITNSTDIIKGNLLYNSSFELGIFGGWSFARQTGTNHILWLTDCYTTNAHSGFFGMDITETNVRYQLESPVFRIRSTNNVWKPYTLSFWGKLHGSITLTCDINPVIPARENFPYTNYYHFTFSTSSTNWTRYTTNFYLCPSPSRDFFISWQHVGLPPNGIYIDDVQLEEGSLTTYSQQDDIEIKLQSDRNLRYFFDGETPSLNLILISKTNTIYTAHFDVYDWKNTIVSNITVTGTVINGLNTNTIYPPSTVGVYRITGYLENISGYSSLEIGYSVLPTLLQSTTLKTNSLFGGHSSPYAALINSNNNFGINWQRTLSSAGVFKWDDIETTQGHFDWNYTDWSTTNMSNIIIFGCFGDIKNGGTNWWWTNGYPQLSPLSNFVYQTVNRYKDRVRYWELINEPQFAYNSNQLAELTQIMVGAIKLADTNAIIVAGGGLTETTYTTNLWDLLDTTTKNNISAISVHLYPPNALWMDTDESSLPYDFDKLQIHTGKPIWNSESGVWGYGMKHGDMTGWLSGGTYLYEHQFEDQHRRDHWQNAEKLMRTALRSLGWLSKYFCYDSRIAGYSYQRVDTQSTFYEWDDSFKPNAVALIFANSLFGEATRLGSYTNINTSNIEAYAFQSDTGASIISLFTKERNGNLTLTVTNSNIGIYNLIGQPVDTNNSVIIITRQPTYWVSRTLTTNQLINTFLNATVLSHTDTNAPNVSIDVSPHSIINGKYQPLRFKWTAVDDLYVNVDDATNVFTRYKIVGITPDWSDWSATRRITVDNLPWDNRGTNQYYLSVQAKDIIGLATNQVDGPIFSVIVTNTARLTANVINIPTLIINQ